MRRYHVVERVVVEHQYEVDAESKADARVRATDPQDPTRETLGESVVRIFKGARVTDVGPAGGEHRG